MANYRLISNPVIHIDDDNGVPLAGGTLKAYDSGTSTPKAFYLDVNGTSSATEITLDARGEAVIYGTGTYKLEVYDADDVLVITIDPYTIMPVSNWAQDFLTKTTAAAARTKLGIGSAYTLDAGGNAGDLVQLDTAGKIPAYDGSQITNLTDTQVYNLPRGWISGLNITTGTNTVAVAVGEARDSTNSADIKLATSFTKTIQASGDWVVGTGNGLDTGGIAANTWYHVFVIKNDSTGNGDILISTSASSPTMPTGYTYFRRIASVRTNTSTETPALQEVSQIGDYFWYKIPRNETSKTVSSSGDTLVLTYTPSGIKSIANLNIGCLAANQLHYGLYVYPNDSTSVSNPDYNTEPPASQLGVFGGSATSAYPKYCFNISVPVGTDRTIKFMTHRLSDGEYNVTVNTSVIGWTDTRGKDD